MQADASDSFALLARRSLPPVSAADGPTILPFSSELTNRFHRAFRRKRTTFARSMIAKAVAERVTRRIVRRSSLLRHVARSSGHASGRAETRRSKSPDPLSPGGRPPTPNADDPPSRQAPKCERKQTNVCMANRHAGSSSMRRGDAAADVADGDHGREPEQKQCKDQHLRGPEDCKLGESEFLSSK